MGLSIHYSGELKKDASLKELIDEVKEIAETFKWEYSIYETEFPNDSHEPGEHGHNLYGIALKPPGSETVPIAFLPNRKMSGLMLLSFYGNETNPEERKYLYMPSVKTQYAGIEVHKVIIHLFKYLEKKYLLNFQMLDEGKYWETGDEKKLEEMFNLYNNLVDSFATAIESFPKKKGESFEAYFSRIIEWVNKKRKNGEF